MPEIDGFSHAKVAILDDNEKVVSGSAGIGNEGIFTINAESSKGVISGSISGLQPQLTRISGSNKIVDVSGQGTGEPQLSLEANDVPDDVAYKLIGAKKDESGSYYVDSDTKPPFAAVELVADGPEGDSVHIALLKGKFSHQEQNLQSNSGDGSTNRATDSFQFTAVNRKSDEKIYKIGFARNSDFSLDKFRNDLFPGASGGALAPA